MRHARGHTDSLTTHSLTHSLTHSWTNKLSRAGVQLVGHTSITQLNNVHMAYTHTIHSDCSKSNTLKEYVTYTFFKCLQTSAASYANITSSRSMQGFLQMYTYGFNGNVTGAVHELRL